MKKPLQIVALTLCCCLSSIHFTNACSCEGWAHPFCEATNESHFVSLIRVIDKPELFLMNVEIINQINLEDSRDTVMVVGQDGVNCGQDLSLFSVGDSLIFSLGDASTSPEFFHDADYYLCGCDYHYLYYTNGQVGGESYTTFVENIDACLDEMVSTEISIEEQLRLFPTLANDQITVQSPAPIHQITIFSTNGQAVLKLNPQNQQDLTFSVDRLQSGIYFVIIEVDGEFISKKIVKQ